MNCGSDSSHEAFSPRRSEFLSLRHSGLKDFDGFYEYDGSSSSTPATHFSEAPSFTELLDIHKLTIAFFAVYDISKLNTFITSLSNLVPVCDFIVHSGSDSRIIAAAFLSPLPSAEIARRVCIQERIPSNQVAVLNSVDSGSLSRLGDYIQ